MNRDDEREELIMNADRAEMLKINTLFISAFYICMITPVFSLFSALAGIVSIILSFGWSYADPLLTFKNLIFGVAMAAAVMGSERKVKKATLASMAVIAVNALLSLDSVIITFLAIIQIILQLACYSKYKNIEYLKAQPGYPDFNTIFFNDRANKRIVSDEQIKENLRENKKGADMDVIELDDPQALEIKKPRTMDDLFTDDLHDDL